MACRYEFLNAARDELDAVIEYLITASGSTRPAETLVAELMRQIDRARENPTMFALSRMPNLAALGYRAMFVDDYIVLYLHRSDTIFIAHIFHQRQDYAHLI